MRLWERMDAGLARAEQSLLVCCLAVMMVTAFAQIAIRNIFGVGLTWSEPMVRYLVLWVGFLGSALAVREGRHITIEVASLWSPARNSRLAPAVSQLVSAGVCTILAWAAIRFVHDEAQIGGDSVLDVPAWIPEAIIPFTFAVMALRFLLRTVKAVQRAPAASNPE